jgi:hypothetical protein
VENYIGIQPDQLIRLKKLPYKEGATVAKAVEEAIQFCIDNNLAECELDYDGFLFDIEPTSDLRTKLNDYHRARGESSHENSVLPIQHVMPRSSLMKEQLNLKRGSRTLNVRGVMNMEMPSVIIECIEHWEPDDEFGSPEHDDASYYVTTNEIDMLIEKLREGKAFLNGA